MGGSDIKSPARDVEGGMARGENMWVENSSTGQESSELWLVGGHRPPLGETLATAGSRKDPRESVIPHPFSNLVLPGCTGLINARNVGSWEAAITPGNMSGGLGWVGERMWAG